MDFNSQILKYENVWIKKRQNCKKLLVPQNKTPPWKYHYVQKNKRYFVEVYPIFALLRKKSVLTTWVGIRIFLFLLLQRKKRNRGKKELQIFFL